MKKIIIAGNWKMNKTVKESIDMISSLRELLNIDTKNMEIVVGIPYTAMSEVKMVAGDKIKIAAQNMNKNDNGAFTGEISPIMLKDLGVEYVILGHSERREYYKESNEIINEKLKSAIKHNLIPILCVGEKLEDRENENTEKVVEDHIRGALKNISMEDVKKVVIAYEPVWAIGTGKTATPEQAEDVHRFIRELLTDMYSKEIANGITIQYGGSMKPENSKELLAKPNIDGGLVGGASLEANSFFEIIKSAL